MDNLAYRDWDNYEEMIDGKVYLMAPGASTEHGHVTVNITTLIKMALRKGPCKVMPDGIKLLLNEKNYVYPDVMVVCRPEIIKIDGIHGAPELIVEVLSPSTKKHDRREKLSLYGEFGVGEYWLVDTDCRCVEVYLPESGKLVLHEVYHLYKECELDLLNAEQLAQIKHEVPVSVIPGLSLKLTDIFENIPL